MNIMKRFTTRKEQTLKTTYDPASITSSIYSPAEGTREELAKPEEH